MAKRGSYLYGNQLESKAAVGTIGAGTDDELPIFVAPFKCRIVGIGIAPAATLTGQATNFTTLSFEAKGSDGSGTDELASVAYNAGSVSSTAFVRDDYTISDTDRVIAEGEVVTFKKTDTGTGLASPDLVAYVYYVRE